MAVSLTLGRKQTMNRFIATMCLFVVLAALTGSGLAEEVLFEDTFDGQLSPEWKTVGLSEDDYRIRDGALELRVHPGKMTRSTPMLMVTIPFHATENVRASVELTLIDPFTELGESAGLYLTGEDHREFGATKKNINGHLVFSPGEVQFIGQPGTEGDPQQYALKFWPAQDAFGLLSIIVSDGYAYFRVGPSASGEYLNFFNSAVRPDEPKRGFCLSASGAPSQGEHWVRFDNFRVVRIGD